MTIYGNLATDPTYPPPGFVPRFSAVNPYSGGSFGLEMDPTTKRLFLKQRKYVYKPERRVDFIAKNRRRIAELCKVLRPISADQTNEKSYVQYELQTLDPKPELLSSDPYFEDHDVDKLLQFADGIDCAECDSKYALDTAAENTQLYTGVQDTLTDDYYQELVEELRYAQSQADYQLQDAERRKNEFYEVKRVHNGTELDYRVKEPDMYEIEAPQLSVEFTNSMANTTAYLQEHYVDLDEVLQNDISHEIVRRVKERQHQCKCDAPFLQPYLFRGRF